MNQNTKTLNISLWIAQVLLAGAFAMAGFTKISTPIEDLRPMMSWVNDFPSFFVRFVGVAELLGGIGMFLPSLLRWRQGLLPLAAFSLTIVMISAAVYHLIKGEYNAIPINLILGTLALFVAWGRKPKKS